MVTTLMALTPDALALCAAIDDGDDGVLPILADLMEDVGDPRAAGLRLIGNRKPHRHYSSREHYWQHFIGCEDEQGYVTDDEFASLEGGSKETWTAFYPCRSAAFLAIAEALTAR